MSASGWGKRLERRTEGEIQSRRPVGAIEKIEPWKVLPSMKAKEKGAHPMRTVLVATTEPVGRGTGSLHVFA